VKIMAIQGHWMRDGRDKKNAHNFSSKIKIKRPGGSLMVEFLDDIKLGINEDY
jgi:hypothetical protein